LTQIHIPQNQWLQLSLFLCWAAMAMPPPPLVYILHMRALKYACHRRLRPANPPSSHSLLSLDHSMRLLPQRRRLQVRFSCHPCIMPLTALSVDSWLALAPSCEVLLFADDLLVANWAAERSRVRLLPLADKTNEFGTPLLSSMWDAA
jgi:hypothetical protein